MFFEVGEDQHDENGLFLDQLEKQINNIFSKVSKSSLSNIFLVYNPSKNNTDTEELERVVMFIKKKLYKLFDNHSKKIKIFCNVSKDKINIYDKLLFLDGLYINIK